MIGLRYQILWGNRFKEEDAIKSNRNCSKKDLDCNMKIDRYFPLNILNLNRASIQNLKKTSDLGTARMYPYYGSICIE